MREAAAHSQPCWSCYMDCSFFSQFLLQYLVMLNKVAHASSFQYHHLSYIQIFLFGLLGQEIITFLTSKIFYLCPNSGNFISIDCGTGGTSYTDEETGIFYNSDADYIFTGENRDIAPHFLSMSTMKPIFRTVRTFPEGNRNCYTLKPVTKGFKYLVRA